MTWRAPAGGATAILVAWLAWRLSPQLLTLLHLDDLEMAGRLGIVVLALTLGERIAKMAGLGPQG